VAIIKGRDSVGIVGLGIMGGAFARNLSAAGWQVVGFDIAKEASAAAAAAGAAIAASVSDVVARCPVVMTSLPSLKAIDAVAAEIGAAGPAGRIVVEMSTIPLEDKERFRAKVEAGGHIAIDCPVSGTGAQAATKDLVLYPSGDSAAIARLADLIADFTRGYYDVGRFGNGSRMKYVANHLVAIHNVASAEAMILAEKAGLDLDIVVRCIGDGAGASRMFQMRAPLMAKADYKPATMKMSIWQKDMDTIRDFARDLGVDTPLFDTTQPIYDQGLQQGRDEEDTASVFSVMGGKGKGLKAP
jgi:3-hydroxyisobutyrate dehydrogenase-like beta-hydroxyacid dehydrogenase